MKKSLFLLALMLIMIGNTSMFAQEQLNDTESYKDKVIHINIGYSQAEIEPSSESLYLETANNIKSMAGLTMNVGGTYFFNKKTEFRPIKAGLAIDFINGTYNMYEEDKFYTHQDNYDITIDELKVGLGIGPAIVFSPAKKLNIQASAKYLPAVSLLNFDTHGDLSEFIGFSNGFSLGVSLSYNWLGFGVEYFIDAVKYKHLDEDTQYIDDNPERTPVSEVFGVRDGKLKTNGIRAFITFRFSQKNKK